VLNRALMLLLLWPLLLPPGFCLCRPSNLGFRASAVETSPAEAPSCPCCRHKTITDNLDTLDQPEYPADDVPHAPVCPAHPSWKILRAATSDTGTSIDDGVTVALWATVALEHPGWHDSAISRAHILEDRPSAPVPLQLRC
jgi:hypothetical protein